MFLVNWGIRKCTSSTYYPHSNGGAELAIKTAKQILPDSTDSYGRLCHDSTARSLLTHCNTPAQALDMYPAMMLYGRMIKDHLLDLQDKYRIHKRWGEIKTHGKLKVLQRTQSPTSELRIGESVQIEKQVSPYPRPWAKTGL